MTEKEINYWFEIFEETKHAFMSKDGKKLSFYDIFKAMKELQNNWNELKNSLKNEIERTNEIIAEDGDMVMMNNIRKMLNDDREVWLFKMQELENRKV